MKITFQTILVVFLFLVFIAGFFVLLNNNVRTESTKTKSNTKTKTETETETETETKTENNCPNLLVRKGNKLSLLNSDAEYNPGKNPLFFNNLEEYKKYVEIQNNNGFFCPVLYLQEENDAQGNDVYKMYSNPFEIENGLQSIQLKNHHTDTDNLDTSKEITFNQDFYRPFNSFGQYNDEFIDTDTSNKNPMNSNWSGIVEEKCKKSNYSS